VHPRAEDLPYLRASFVALEQLARAHGRDPEQVRAAIEAGLLPRPAYVLADGTELVAPDFFALSDAAGGDRELKAWFGRAYKRAAAAHPAADPAAEAWADYLSGAYAACLRSVSPATIVRKAVLMARIEGLLEEVREGDPEWGGELRRAVDALDALERPFAAIDRRAGPVSRDRLIGAVRERFPALWPD
jgi:predicted NBD/HSP70 family sugar kinase